MQEATEPTINLTEFKTKTQKWKALLQLAWPLIVANSFWNLQLTIDRVYLGNYSTEALGAALAVMGLFWTPMALLQQTAAYVVTFVAQYYGAKEFKMIGPALWQSLYISVLGGLLFLLFIPFSDMIFAAIDHAPKVQLLEVEYFNAICFSALPMALVAAASSFFTGLGDTKVVIKINAVGLVVNIVLDYLLIFGHWGFPKLGVTGAGYATAAASLASAVYALYLIFNNKTYETEYGVLTAWKYNLDLMKRFIKFGVPSGLQWALEGLAFTVFLIVVGRMQNGEAALASSSIAITLMMLSVLPALGVAQAVSVIVGQALGEQKPSHAEEASWTGLQLALMYIITVGCSFLLFPEFYMNWFKNTENAALWNDVSTIVPFLLAYVAVFTCFDSMNLIFSFALKGAGDTRFVSLVALTLPWPIMVIPTLWIKDWDNAIYWAWGFTSLFIIIQAIVFWLRFATGKWKKMTVIH